MREIFYLLVVGTMLLVGCKDGSVNPVPSGDYSICYEKSYNGQWEIFTNNISGTDPQNISNYHGDDEYPQWSPDGRYIVYSRRLPSSVVEIVVYDTKTTTNTMLTNDSVNTGLTPQWTPDGKICYFAQSSYDVYDSGATYLINPDGSQRKKILDFRATIYFYEDSYNFLYFNGTNVFKTNIDNTTNGLVLTLPPPGSEQFITIRDFNPFTRELLVNTNTVANSSSAIVTINAETKQTSIVIIADTGYQLAGQRFSKDYSMIVFNELGANDEYLSVLQSGVKKRLIRILFSSPPIHFSSVPMEFSPDSKYIAFSEEIYHSGQWVSFSTPLFLIDVTNAIVWKLDDEAHGPSWNPQ